MNSISDDPALKKIKDTLNRALSEISLAGECVLLDFPDHFNAGDHFIWLGEIIYLTNVLKSKIGYSTGYTNYSDTKLRREVSSKAPIFFHVGGNLGDLYPQFQEFRERIISQYPDRRIIIFPQSIFFRDERNLQKAKRIFNAHTNLTIFARERASYEIASREFNCCKVVQAPDMAFQLMNIIRPHISKRSNDAVLFLGRTDMEKGPYSFLSHFDREQVIREDWNTIKLGNGMYRYPFIWRFRMRWRNLLMHPSLMSSVVKGWIRYKDLKGKYPERCHISGAPLSSWDILNISVDQLSAYKLIITDRLHAHILSILLGIPSVLLENSYHKNKSFYESWTSRVPHTRFVADLSELGPQIDSMLTGPYASSYQRA